MTSRASLAVLAGSAALAAACGRSEPSNVITASGHVEATQVRIAAKTPGTLATLRVDEGDRVSSGQTLAEVDTVDVRLALDAARADRSMADAELRLRAAGSRREDIAEARAQVARAQADLEGAEKDLVRMEGLLAAGSGTQKSRDDARVRRDAAAAALTAARERSRKTDAGSRPEEIDAARARVAAADARIAQLEQQVKDAAILSPVAGIITEKVAEQGELLARGSAVVVVTDLADAWLTVYVAEPDLARIRLGQEAEVRTDDGQTRQGKVTFIASQAEFTPKNVQTRDERVKLVFKVKVGLPNQDGLFKPGMPAEARLTAAGA
jgi:HlyD family secretion protein